MKKDHSGLSPSSLGLYQACSRKYYFKKVVKTPIDSDASEDTEAFSVGKAFHKCLENVKHDLSGFTYKDAGQVVLEHGLTEELHLPLIFSMLKKYKETHNKAGLKAIACEVLIETPEFYGVVDVVLKDSLGNWWIGDLKTSASFGENQVPGLFGHPQLNLYAAHAAVLAKGLEIDPSKFLGCRYRVTTKSKMGRKSGESDASFMGRLAGSIRSLDIVLPISSMQPRAILATHLAALDEITLKSKDPKPDKFLPNYGNCMSYFRPCEFWSQCHGKNYTQMKEVEALEG